MAEPQLSSPPPLPLALCVEEFNLHLRRLAAAVAAFYPADPQVCRTKNKVLLAIEMTPLRCIRDVGPHLYHYRYEIYEGNEAFFLGETFASELEAGGENAALAAHLIGKMKEAWRASTPEERGQYTRTVQALLDLYLDFLAAFCPSGAGQPARVRKMRGPCTAPR
jgi:hypothetical protein